jgi:RNA polymerase sigma-70 factor (ECF subfamily)
VRSLSRNSSLDDPESAIPEPEAQGGNPGDRLDVQAGLEQLPAKQRDLVKMIKLDGLSVQEACLKTGYSPSDVRVSVHRGLKALKKILGGTGQ